MDWREGYVTGGDTRFWVRETGRGDDLAVLLHGFPLDGGSWAGVARGLVGRGWRVAAPDLKGVGRTESSDGGFDPRTLADEVSQLVRNLHARRVLLVGHGWGGAVALATAFRHPGRVDGLVLVASPYRSLDLRHAWHIALCNVPVLPELAFRAAPEALVRLTLALQSNRPLGIDPDLVQSSAAAMRTTPSAWLGYYRTLSRRALLAQVVRGVRGRLPVVADPTTPPRLRVPALVVWGQHDPVYPVATGREVAADLGASLEVLPGVGHLVPLEDPIGLVTRLERFAVGAEVRRVGRSDAAG